MYPHNIKKKNLLCFTSLKRNAIFGIEVQQTMVLRKEARRIALNPSGGKRNTHETTNKIREV